MRNLMSFFGGLRIRSLNPFVLSFAIMFGTPGQAIAQGYVTKIVVRLSDDSPEDGEGGTVFYSEHILIDGQTADIFPIIEGGLWRQGVLEASGSETITLCYDITSFSDYDYKLIKKIEFELVLANDYRVGVTSNLQTNSSGEMVFLLVTRAEGNVKDGSNQRIVRFQYDPGVITDVEEQKDVKALPQKFSLSPNFPNPFNPATEIRYQLPGASDVQIAIYNLLGQEVRQLVDGPVEAGYRSVLWDSRDSLGREVGSGVYLVQMKAKDFVQVRKMVKLQ